ncbi:hypothetical protein B0J15DRAFT_248555 [Fusarium solani]|uniref:Uncharacterized protein n=1 Tax=Fusarium solani TaxID=169388 RepID=A0A9P9KQ60_FUSSL|nr:uncharacterized protein B0J15DRAFT_248555 [Fusarium solani]KAH7266464.1 hypothetical protein B0J15DRAFT_248555 [Fusarium solani]
MSPPPSTPTPRRFLLAKRGATQSSQTPTGPPRFQSTPRFGSSSVPRPTQSRAVVDIEDVEEVEDLVEESSSNTDDEGLETKKHVPLNDSIEVEDDDVTASRDVSVGINISEDDEEEIPQRSIERKSPDLLNLPHDTSPLEEREPKRRRVSISPMPESSPLGEHHYLNEDNLQDAEEREHTPTQSSIESLQDAIPTHDEARAPQQPTFRPPPRFKPAEVDPTVEGLPAAFSPQRRGAKYVAGGLAAGLQGWLSEVKGWEGTVPSAAAAAVSVVKVVVEEVRPGRRMYLVTGRPGDDGAAPARRFLLAGEGRLTGLGQRAAVSVGNVVEVGQPVWDVELDGQVWTVACDWGVS